MKILLVDDDVELGSMLREYLEAEGFSATVALTGTAGVAGALSGEYAAMILDIMLPDMSGIDVLSKVRKQSRLPIIMLTAKGTISTGSSGWKWGRMITCLSLAIRAN
ncbi:Staphylococcal respiratory response protein A [Budvicia aquatica]|uniref:Staphylococcal respiratory response protein A n=1 Tax=Budvicia aquatica TaxID=82979 RepID=A0A484ZZ17_9GAMM|nr:Staphylococcal respiratory response protein A [Budvicia aquatica]